MSENNLQLKTRSGQVFSNPQLTKEKRIKTKKMSKLDISLALKFIPEFDGSSVDLIKFLECCDFVNKPLEDNETDKFLQIVKSKLTGRAYNLIRNQTFTNWASFRDELYLHFHDARNTEQLLINLVTITQRPNEDVRSYGVRVEQILSEILEIASEKKDASEKKIISEYHSDTALRYFLNGLNDELKIIVKASNPKTLRDAIQKGVNEENTVKRDKSNLPKCNFCNKVGHVFSNCRQRSNNNYNFSSNMNRQHPNNFSYSRTENRNIPSTSFNFPTPTNFLQTPRPSNRPNNTQQFNRSQFQNRYNPSQPRFVGAASLICAYCKVPNHHISSCYKKKYYDLINNTKNIKLVQEQEIDAGNEKGLDQQL